MVAYHPWLAELVRKEAGRWITIGGSKGEGGKRHGGSPVFIKDGKIVKGHPSLTGKKIGDLKGDAEQGSHRQQINQSRGHAKASLRKQARKEGHDPNAVESLANEIKAHHDAFAAERKDVLRQAREFSKNNGLADLQRRGKDSQAAGHEDAAYIRGFDQTAEHVHDAFPHHFHPETGEHGSHADQLHAMLTEGHPEPMEWGHAFKTAMEHIGEPKPKGKKPKTEDRGYPADWDEIPKMLHHPWLITKSAQFDESQHKRDAGKFSSTAGSRGQARPSPKGPRASGKPSASTPTEHILSQPGAAKFGFTRQRLEQMSPSAVAEIAAQLGFKKPEESFGAGRLYGGSGTERDTPFIIYDAAGKPVGKTTDENVAAAAAKKHGGQYGFEGDSKRYGGKAQPPPLPRPMAVDSTRGALQEHERQRRAGMRPGAMRPSPPPLPPRAVAAAQKIGQAAVGKPIQALARQLQASPPEVQQAFSMAAKLTEHDTPEQVKAKVDAAFSKLPVARFAPSAHDNPREDRTPRGTPEPFKYRPEGHSLKNDMGLTLPHGTQVRGESIRLPKRKVKTWHPWLTGERR